MKANRIFLRLKGGLGNQLFQYAFARSLCLRKQAELVVDLGSFDSDPFDRQYELQNFNVKVDSFVKRRQIEINVRRSISLILGRNDFVDEERLCRFYELGNIFCVVSKVNEIPFTCRRLFVEGYWQSEKYFSDCRHRIREELSFKLNPAASMKDIGAQLLAQNSVVVGVRRYEEVPQGKSYILGADYYEKAFVEIESRITSPIYYVFSTLPKAAHDLLPRRKNMVFMIPSPRPCEDLWLMSHCHSYIISNSTYYWWAAWLRKTSDGVVIAPQHGWANLDMIPDCWMTLD